MMEDDDDSSYRAKIILLKDEGYTVPEIRMATNHHDINIRKWIHRFNEKGVDGIIPRKHKHKHKHKQVKISIDIETKIVEIASKNPRQLWTTFFNMVFESTSWRICIKGTKPCGFHKPYRD